MTTSKSTDLRQIYLIRAVASILVVIAHSIIYTSSLQIFSGVDIEYFFKFFGAFGVDIFFVLSGFILPYAFDINPKSPRRFVSGRFFRIYPVYFFVFFLALIIGFAKSYNKPFPWSFIVVLKSMFLIPEIDQSGKVNNVVGIGWTLSYELIFYFVFSAGIFLGARFKLVYTSFLLIILVIVAQIVFNEKSFFGNPIIFEFIFGMLVYYAFKGDYLIGRRIFIISGGVFVFWVLMLRELGWIGFEDKFKFDRFLTLGIPAALLLIFSLGLPDKITNRYVEHFGKASYSLYLTHFVICLPAVGFVINFCFSDNKTMLNNYYWFYVICISCVFLSLFFASIFYVFVEVPIGRYFSLALNSPSNEKYNHR